MIQAEELPYSTTHLPTVPEFEVQDASADQIRGRGAGVLIDELKGFFQLRSLDMFVHTTISDMQIEREFARVMHYRLELLKILQPETSQRGTESD